MVDQGLLDIKSDHPRSIFARQQQIEAANATTHVQDVLVVEIKTLARSLARWAGPPGDRKPVPQIASRIATSSSVYSSSSVNLSAP